MIYQSSSLVSFCFFASARPTRTMTVITIASSPQNLIEALAEWQPSAAPKWVDRSPS